LLGKGSLRQAQVEPLAPDVVTHGAEASRVTAWQGARSRRLEPETGKRQRNGASAGGWAIRNEGANARRMSCAFTPLA
jgi:hypothetical protein